ncbi:MAG: serine hydrolase [Anaerovoracaceae bacterium]|nr:serine hydrolase [Anaerovoracaceae bacterium]
MKKELRENILAGLRAMDGKVGFYFKNLVTDESFGYNEKEQFLPASIVKVPLLAAILLMRERGETSFDETITVRADEKLPGCGAIQHMTGDKDGSVTLDIATLYKLMIVISDTTATNALYKHYGNDKIIGLLKELGLKGTQFNRAFYDSVREEKGIQNYFVPEEIGILLEKMYRKTLISPQASETMQNILLMQQVNHKMGGKLPIGFPIAHKTGEEEDKTHDVGIVFGKEPFVACFASYQSDIPRFEQFIRDTTYEIAKDIDPLLVPAEGIEGFF